MTSIIELAEPLRRAFAGSARVPACHQQLIGAETLAGARGTLAAYWLPAGAGINDVATAEMAVYLLAGSGLRRAGAGRGHPMAPGEAIYYSPGANRALSTAADSGALFLAASAAIGPAPPLPFVRGDVVDEGTRIGAVTDDGSGALGTHGGFAGMGVRWLVNEAAVGARNLSLATSVFASEGSHDRHRHRGADEFFLVLTGGGKHLTAAAPLRVGAGETVYVPAGEWHGFRAHPGVVTSAVYGYLGAPSLEAAGYELLGPAVTR
jgi:quercetin dioxygenase-like cupin family protein